METMKFHSLQVAVAITAPKGPHSPLMYCPWNDSTTDICLFSFCSKTKWTEEITMGRKTL